MLEFGECEVWLMQQGDRHVEHHIWLDGEMAQQLHYAMRSLPGLPLRAWCTELTVARNRSENEWVNVHCLEWWHGTPRDTISSIKQQQQQPQLSPSQPPQPQPPAQIPIAVPNHTTPPPQIPMQHATPAGQPPPPGPPRLSKRSEPLNPNRQTRPRTEPRDQGMETTGGGPSHPGDGPPAPMQNSRITTRRARRSHPNAASSAGQPPPPPPTDTLQPPTQLDAQDLEMANGRLDSRSRSADRAPPMELSNQPPPPAPPPSGGGSAIERGRSRERRRQHPVPSPEPPPNAIDPEEIMDALDLPVPAEMSTSSASEVERSQSRSARNEQPRSPAPTQPYPSRETSAASTIPYGDPETELPDEIPRTQEPPSQRLKKRLF
eukprot:1917235-Amphidinium_carterae.2